MKQGKPLPPARSRRSSRQPLQKEQQIKEPAWSAIDGDLKKAWIRETNDNKEMVIAQFVAESKSIVPVTKNRNLHTVYLTESNDDDGYKSDFTANTQNSEGTFQFDVNSTVFDATADANSNGEILEGSQYDLNVNATAARKGKPSILRGKQRK